MVNVGVLSGLSAVVSIQPSGRMMKAQRINRMPYTMKFLKAFETRYLTGRFSLGELEDTLILTFAFRINFVINPAIGGTVDDENRYGRN